MIANITAVDPDSGDNGFVTYRIVNQVPFSIDELTGALSVAETLDREEIPQYSVSSGHY